MLISDIHLRDYHRYNKYPNQRLESFNLLAEEIVKIGKEKNVETMLIGGDIVDKNTLSPSELHTLFSMFTKLAKQFRIYSIIGNHDAKSKRDIETSDTVITLLEEIDGISFHHQEILNIGGRTVAFENWMPEYDLSWIEKPVDIYMSHATIDYDNAGLYGMDTSVFDGKFTVGLFGDIHVNRQIDNLISIGNTKQESLSDKYQGGVMIMDLADLSFERIPIDPEHKKFLYLTTTEDEDEEGWVDKDGEDMTYRVYRPKRVQGKQFEFKLPKITDIDTRTTKIMKEFNLYDLHKTIKSESTYSQVDFDFTLIDLEIENYRSIKKYKLDFSDDFLITGPNGTGKSSLITALFYALVGNRTLKREVKFGETDCRLVVRLTYQGIEYKITRGTAKGDFGLKVGDNNLKFNSKLEFEKTVYEYLPFLNYHESFFFNYWDTELLGSMKLDKRYDLLSKYYRLDALSTYNDSATAKLKPKKKSLKDLSAEVLGAEVLKDSRKEDYDQLKTELSKTKSEKEVDSILDLQTGASDIVKQINNLTSECSRLNSLVEESSTKISSQEILLSSLKTTLNTKRDLAEVEDLIKERETSDGLKSRIEKGTKYIEGLQTSTNENTKDIELIDQKLKNLGNSEILPIPENLVSSINTLQEEIEDYKLIKSTKFSDLNSRKSYIERDIESINKKIKELSERAEEGDEICNSCGQNISHEEMISQQELAKTEKEKELSSIKEDLNILTEEYNSKDLELLKKEKLLVSETKKLESLKESNILFEKNSKERLNLLSTKSVHEKNIKECKDNIEAFSGMLDDLKVDFSKLKPVSDEEFILLKSDLRNLNLIKETSSKLSSLRKELEPEIEESKSKLEEYKSKLESLQEDLEEHELMEDSEFQEIKELKYKYNTLRDLKTKYDFAEKEYKQKSKDLKSLEQEVITLEEYVNLTSRSGSILKSILEDLTKTFSSPQFKFSTARVQANGKVVTDMSVDFLVGKRWVPYYSLSSGQKTLCDLYYISKVVTRVGVVSFDETLRFLDDENLKVASSLIDSIKKNNVIISSHSSNLSMEGTKTLKVELLPGNTSNIVTIV